jgi:hypothetical protein
MDTREKDEIPVHRRTAAGVPAWLLVVGLIVVLAILYLLFMVPR